MNKTALIIITLGLIAVIGIIFMGGKDGVQSVEIIDGVQYVRIDAGGGYYPRTTVAKGGIPTKLIVKTEGVFDCSASLVIPSIGYKSILPQTGETEIDLGTPNNGESFQGLCGMGMYSFQVEFKS